MSILSVTWGVCNMWVKNRQGCIGDSIASSTVLNFFLNVADTWFDRRYAFLRTSVRGMTIEPRGLSCVANA